jgi:hypothetical protein
MSEGRGRTFSWVRSLRGDTRKPSRIGKHVCGVYASSTQSLALYYAVHATRSNCTPCSRHVLSHLL